MNGKVVLIQTMDNIMCVVSVVDPQGSKKKQVEGSSMNIREKRPMECELLY